MNNDLFYEQVCVLEICPCWGDGGDISNRYMGKGTPFGGKENGNKKDQWKINRRKKNKGKSRITGRIRGNEKINTELGIVDRRVGW
jgi:hypothetical protein